MTAGARKDRQPVALIAEKDRGVTVVLRAILREEGVDAVAVNEREEALRVAAELCPDLFLIGLGGRSWRHDGIALARFLRHSGFTRTPMIVLSSSPSGLEWALRTGLFQAMIEKPFSAEEITQAVNRLLDR